MSNSQNVDLSGVSQEEVDRFCEFVPPVCYTCGNVIGPYRDPYIERIEVKEQRPEKAFEDFGIRNACCRMAIANPVRIPPGKIYHNPNLQGKVEFASEGAEQLFNQLVVNNEAAKGTQVNIDFDIEDSPGSMLEQVTQVSITPQPTEESLPGKSEFHSSTAIPEGTTLVNSNEEAEVSSGTPAIIDASYFDDDFKAMVGDETSKASTSEVPSLIPSLGNQRSSGLSALGRRRNDSLSTSASSIFGAVSEYGTETSSSASKDAKASSVSYADTSDENETVSSMLAGQNEGPVFGKPDIASISTGKQTHLYMPETIRRIDASGRTIITHRFS